MKVLVTSAVGFCSGVRRAVEQSIKQAMPGRTFTLGPLIHNPQVVQFLERQGVFARERLESFQSGELLIIPAQGIPKASLELARQRGVTMLDTTCPELTRTRNLMVKSATEGYQIAFLGDPGHAETESLLSFVPNAILIPSSNRVSTIAWAKKVAIFVQSTQTLDALQSLSQAVLAKTDELRIFNTICQATRRRQESLRRLLPKVGILVVVGGLNSANTQRLAQMGESAGKKVYHIETAEDLDLRWLDSDTPIGVTSGASTPIEVVQEVVARLEQFSVFGEKKQTN
jgi:(E)-4-hydroxy-3-methyl-but-2-enyl pyrophosphate reductase